MVYYKGTEETTSDGFIVLRKSDDGINWAGEQTILSLGPTNIAKGANITKLANGNLLLVYNLVQVSPTVRLGIYIMQSTDDGDTWGAAAQVDILGYTDEAEGGPIIQLAAGTLVCPWWGTAGGAVDCGVIFSADNGATWAGNVLIGDGSADGLDYSEPNVIEYSAGNLLCSIRETSTEDIYGSVSADSGASWSAPASMFDGKSAARMCLLSNGKIITVYRSAVAAGDPPAYRTSADNGATWSAEQVLLSGPEETYGGAVELSGDRVGVVYGARWAATDGAIHYRIINFADLP